MLDTVKRSGGADDVCRARYDCLLFALERHAADNNERKKHAAKSGTTSAARRRILELGALSLLEAELEDVRALCVGGADGKQQRDVSGYASCLEAMVDRHYDNLRDLHDDHPSDDDLHGRTPSPSTSISMQTVKGGRVKPVDPSTVIARLPALALARDPLAQLHFLKRATDNARDGDRCARQSRPSTDTFPVNADLASAKNIFSPEETAGGGAGVQAKAAVRASDGGRGREASDRQTQHEALIENPYRKDAGPAAASSRGGDVAHASNGARPSPFPPSVVRGTPRHLGPQGTVATVRPATRDHPPAAGTNEHAVRGARIFGGAASSGQPSNPIVSHASPPKSQEQNHRHQHHPTQQGTDHYGIEPSTGAVRGVHTSWDAATRGGGAAAAGEVGWAGREVPRRGGRGGGMFGEGGGDGLAPAPKGAFTTARELHAGMTREGNNNHGGSRGSLSGMGDGGARRDERMWDGQDRCDDSGRERGLRGAGRDGWANQGQANNNNSGLGVGLNGYSNNSNGRSYYSNRTNDFSSSKGPTNTYSNNGYNDNNNVGYSGYHTAGRGTPNGRSNNGHDPSGFPGHTNAGSGFEQQGQLNVPARLPNCPGLKRKFVPPGRVVNTNSGSGTASNSSRGNFPGSAALGGGKGGARGGGGGDEEEDQLPEELQHLEKAMVDKIVQEIQQKGDPVTFEQIAGLEFAKKSVIELVCWPMARPDIFTGLRSLPKGLLLFGPPGTGKTLIGKAIAHQSGATFFSISASSLCSKWIGEGEKLVRTLFAVAGYYQPAVIFIDEVDSMLSMRSADENEASRRLKTEFLIQLDGAGTKASDRVLVVGATNRPQELDEAARRRFVKRLYVPLPDESGRRQLMQILLKTSAHSLTDSDVESIVKGTEGFSGADLHALCTEAAMGPVRDLGSSICSVRVSDVPPMETRHFEEARRSMRPSVGPDEITHYLKWNEEFGSFQRGQTSQADRLH